MNIKLASFIFREVGLAIMWLGISYGVSKGHNYIGWGIFITFLTFGPGFSGEINK